MSDLYIDGGMLDRVKGNFGRITELLGEPAKKMKHLNGAEVGPSSLVKRVNEFGDEWSYGIEQLGKFSDSVVDSLQAIDDAFTEVDANLSAALNKAKKGDS